MPLTNSKRRLVLKLLSMAPFAAVSASSVHSSAQIAVDVSTINPSLPKLLDVLIPRDVSPSASDLHLHHELMDVAHAIPNYPYMIDAGLSWLEQSALMSFNRDFLYLTANQKERLIDAAFRQPAQTLPKVFVERVRDDSMSLYYEHPSVLLSLGINGPIQPRGYPGHARYPE